MRPSIGSLAWCCDAANAAHHMTQVYGCNATDQLVAAGQRLAFVGDDTWMQLFPHQFGTAAPFPSFNVQDLHTVDNGVWEVRPALVIYLAMRLQSASATMSMLLDDSSSVTVSARCTRDLVHRCWIRQAHPWPCLSAVPGACAAERHRVGRAGGPLPGRRSCGAHRRCVCADHGRQAGADGRPAGPGVQIRAQRGWPPSFHFRTVCPISSGLGAAHLQFV